MVRSTLNLRLGRSVMLALLLYSGTLWAAVSAQLSEQSIDELETVRLSIKITETRQADTLDLAPLEQDFSVLSTNTVSQSRFMNGRGHSWVDYQITLQPKRTGTLTVPAITVGNEATPTLQLVVNPLSTETRRLIDELVFFETTVSAAEVYVQAELILTRRLLYSQGVQLYSDMPGAPALTDAVVLPLGETRSGTTERNGRPYGVVEQQYAIYPERSGDFSIPPIGLTASVRLAEAGRMSRKGVNISTENINVKVLPVPAEYPADQPWLPAERVTLMAAMTPDLSTYAVGDTLDHELLVHVQGNIGTIIPPVDLALNEAQFRSYPQAPEIQDDTSGDTVKGTRLQTRALVPLQPGDRVIPGSELVWWDTVHKRVRLSASKPRTIRITGTAVETPAMANPDTTPAMPPRETAADTASGAAALALDTDSRWKIGGVLVGLALLIVIVIRTWRRTHRRAARNRPGSAQATTATASISRAAARRALRAAVQDDKTPAPQFLRLLQQVAGQSCGLPSAAAWQQLRAQSTLLTQLTDALQASIYGTAPALSADQRRHLADAALALHQGNRNPTPARQVLPALYPTATR